MATQSKNTLKGYFNTGDKPTESNFVNLIDSFVHKTEDRSTTAEVQTGTNNTKFVTPAGAKAAVQHFVPNASETVKGLIEIATVAEAEEGTSTSQAVTPAGAKKAVEKFAPVKKVNGLSPDTNGEITIPITEDSNWNTVTAFVNGTSSYNGSTTVRFRKRNGVVFLDGCIKGGVAQTNGTGYTLFTLPAGYRPQRRASFILLRADTSLTTYVVGRIDIATNGAVYGVNYSDLWNSLSGISFPIPV